jgi:hypothetical protein
MTGKQIAELTRRAIENWTPALTADQPLGVRRSMEREYAELDLLKQSLVLPSRRPRKDRGDHVWLVAVHDTAVVFFDEATGEYGLGGLTKDGAIDDWQVYGDVIGCFASR